jgi:putative ABC transport system permease protein
MLKHYLIVALRYLGRHRGYAFINVFGLAFGIACCGLMLLYVRHEFGFDTFHEHADRIYRVAAVLSEDGREEGRALVPSAVARALEELPEVQRVVTLNAGGRPW